MCLLNTTCEHSQCRVEKVCESLDLITGWPSFGNNNLNQKFPVVADQICTTFRGEFWTILVYKTVSDQQYSWDVWCESLPWGHVTAFKSVWGQDSDRAAPQGWFSSVIVHLLLYLGRCPVPSLIFCWGKSTILNRSSSESFAQMSGQRHQKTVKDKHVYRYHERCILQTREGPSGLLSAHSWKTSICDAVGASWDTWLHGKPAQLWRPR